MNRNSKMLIVGGIGIIMLIVLLYNNQEPKKFDSNFYDSKIKNLYDIDKKLDKIKNKTNSNEYTSGPREWITSGPFQIDRSKYVIGEKIFLRIGGLDINEKGQIAILRTTNDTHYTVYQTIPFDGMKNFGFNFYADVRLSKALGICSTEDIIGEWLIVFRGTKYENIKFEFINQILPGEEDSFTKPVC